MSREPQPVETATGFAAVTSAAQLELIVHQLPTAVLVAEAPGGRVMLSNAQVEEIWRRPLTSAEEEGEGATWDAYHLDGRPCQAAEWPLNRTAATGERIDGLELEIRRGAGTRAVSRV